MATKDSGSLAPLHGAGEILRALGIKELGPILGEHPVITRLGALIGAVSGGLTPVFHPCWPLVAYVSAALGSAIGLLLIARRVYSVPRHLSCAFPRTPGAELAIEKAEFQSLLGGLVFTPELRKQRAKYQDRTTYNTLVRGGFVPTELWSDGSRIVMEILVLLVLFVLAGSFASLVALGPARILYRNGGSPVSTAELDDPGQEKSKLQAFIDAKDESESEYFLCSDEQRDVQSRIQSLETFITRCKDYNIAFANDRCIGGRPSRPSSTLVLPSAAELEQRKRDFEKQIHEIQDRRTLLQDAITTQDPIVQGPTVLTQFYYLTGSERGKYEQTLAVYRAGLTDLDDEERKLRKDRCLKVKLPSVVILDLPLPTLTVAVREANTPGEIALTYSIIIDLQLDNQDKYEFVGSHLVIECEDRIDHTREPLLRKILQANEPPIHLPVGGGNTKRDRFRSGDFFIRTFIEDSKIPGQRIALKEVPPNHH